MSESKVWKYFAKQDSKAKCLECDTLITRGSKPKLYSTTPLINHLKNQHQEKFKAFEKGRDKDKQNAIKTSSDQVKSQQPTLDEVLEKKKIFDINSSRAKTITRTIGKFDLLMLIG